MLFEQFLMGNIRNSMLHALVILVRGLTCFIKLARLGLYGNHSLLNSSLRSKTIYITLHNKKATQNVPSFQEVFINIVC